MNKIKVSGAVLATVVGLMFAAQPVLATMLARAEIPAHAHANAGERFAAKQTGSDCHFQAQYNDTGAKIADKVGHSTIAILS